MESDYPSRIEKIKSSYLSELKHLKDHNLKMTAALKVKEKVISQLVKIVQKQEFQLSSEDFRIYLEFDREP